MYIDSYGRIMPSDPNELCHHGVKGMHWGDRNGPPYPLSAGKHSAAEKKAGWEQSLSVHRVRSADKTRKAVDSIIDSMSEDDREKVLAGSDHYLNLEEGSAVMKRVLKQIGDIPVSFFDLLEEDKDTIQVALGTRSGSEYRGKGYANSVTDQAMNWIDKNKKRLTQKQVVWGVRVDNPGSIRIAERHGFVRDENSYSDDGMWVNYVKKLNGESNSSNSKSVTSRVKALRSSGNSYAEIAKKLGISESSVGYYLNL